MADWNTDSVRETFVKFFEEKHAHTHVPSSSVLPHNDPTLLFVNAGMNQFKSVFLGSADPDSELGRLKRAANSQRCIRAGGKHNDLEDVGRDTYHHTMFEMLGSWSFGDYFKKEACAMAWELLTEVYKMDPTRMYVTYFEGSEELGIPCDDETRQIWLDLGIPASRLVAGNAKDNFWEMGATGPCGTASEIHYDRIGGRDASSLVNMDDESVIEIWNLVFMEFDRQSDGSLCKLPNRNIDTGMGLERLTSILINKSSNYDTDAFQPIFARIHELVGGAAYTTDLADPRSVAYRVVADHMRTLTVAIADGQDPDKAGKGYVLRRILRRAVHFASENLGAKPGFLSKLVPIVVERLTPVFPQLPSQQERVVRMVRYEEDLFHKTLTNGVKEFNKVIEDLSTLDKKPQFFPADKVAVLYDTHGFPFDLTSLKAQALGYKVDKKAAKACLAEMQAQGAVGGKAAAKTLFAQLMNAVQDASLPATDDSFKFNGQEDIDANVVMMFDPTGNSVIDVAANCADLWVLLDRTNFYACMGGQVGDRGNLILSSGKKIQVLDTQATGGYVVHICKIDADVPELHVGAKVTAQLNWDLRNPIMANHTTTHLLNHALYEVVGSSVCQRGSFVDAPRFRFDFSSRAALEPEQLADLEAHVQRVIDADVEVFSKEVAKEKALSIRGLRTLAGEDYTSMVRVVSVGNDVDHLLQNPSNEEWAKSSIEFCGGTHISRTGDAKLFKIISESPLAAGVRRIEAVTGVEAVQAATDGEQLQAKLAAIAVEDPIARLAALKEVKKDVAGARLPAVVKHQLNTELDTQIKAALQASKSAGSQSQEWATSKAEELKALSPADLPSYVISEVSNNGDRKEMAVAVDLLRQAAPDTPILLVSEALKGKKKSLSLYADVPQSMLDTLKANEWVNAAAAAASGRGGGRPQTAQATAPQTDKVAEVIAAAIAYLSK